MSMSEPLASKSKTADRSIEEGRTISLSQEQNNDNNNNDECNNTCNNNPCYGPSTETRTCEAGEHGF